MNTHNIKKDLKLCGKCRHLDYWDGYYCDLRMKDTVNFPNDDEPYDILSIISCDYFQKRESCKLVQNNNKAISNEFNCPFWCLECEYKELWYSSWKNKKGLK